MGDMARSKRGRIQEKTLATDEGTRVDVRSIRAKPRYVTAESKPARLKHASTTRHEVPLRHLTARGPFAQPKVIAVDPSGIARPLCKRPPPRASGNFSFEDVSWLQQL